MQNQFDDFDDFDAQLQCEDVQADYADYIPTDQDLLDMEVAFALDPADIDIDEINVVAQLKGEVWVNKTDDVELHRNRYGFWELIKVVDGEEWIIRSEQFGQSYQELRTAYMMFQAFKASN